MSRETLKIANYWAGWAVDAIATATQDKRLLEDDQEYDPVLVEAIEANTRKAIINALAIIRQLEREVELLREENKALRCHIERQNSVIFETLTAIDDGDAWAVPFEKAREIYNETPTQSLAAVRAEAVEQYGRVVGGNCVAFEKLPPEVYAQQLRSRLGCSQWLFGVGAT